MKVVCINVGLDDDIIEGCFLTLGKSYTIHEKEDITFFDMLPKFYGLNDDDGYGYYFQSRFIPLKEYRKRKLKKINKSV